MRGKGGFGEMAVGKLSGGILTCEGRADETYLFLFVALLAQILASSGHLSAAHGVFFGGEMFFGLRFWKGDGQLLGYLFLIEG